MSITNIIAHVSLLAKYFRASFMPNRDIYDSIAIFIAFNSINDDFNTKTSSLLESGNKSLNKI